MELSQQVLTACNGLAGLQGVEASRLLGMGFGLLVTAFVISMILWPVNQVNTEKQIIKPERIEGSLLYKPLSDFAPAVFPYLKKQEWKEFIPRKEAEEENVVTAAI